MDSVAGLCEWTARSRLAPKKLLAIPQLKIDKTTGPIYARAMSAHREGSTMPMIELSFVKGALTASQVGELMQRATKVLMWWEKLPDTPTVRATSWAYVDEFESGSMFVGGLPPRKPRYRFRVHTMEGLMDDRAKQGVMRDLTRLTLDIEGSPRDDDNKARIWCIIREYPRANWGVAGALFPPNGWATAHDEISFSGDEPID